MIDEFKNPHFMPQISATAFASFSCVESPSSTILNNITLTTSFFGTTLAIVSQVSGVDADVEARLNLFITVSGVEKGEARDVPDSASVSACGFESRYLASKSKDAAISRVWTVCIRKSELHILQSKITATQHTGGGDVLV